MLDLGDFNEDIMDVIREEYNKIAEKEKIFKIWKSRTITLKSVSYQEKTFFKFISNILNDFYDKYLRLWDINELEEEKAFFNKGKYVFYVNGDNDIFIYFDALISENFYYQYTLYDIEYQDIIDFLKYKKITIPSNVYDFYQSSLHLHPDKNPFNPYNIFFGFFWNKIKVLNIQYQ